MKTGGSELRYYLRKQKVSSKNIGFHREKNSKTVTGFRTYGQRMEKNQIHLRDAKKWVHRWQQGRQNMASNIFLGKKRIE